MNILRQWDDNRYLSKNTLYRLKSGVRLLVVKKRATKDFVVEACFPAGAHFESEVGVPRGTAHFLEHMLTNPNAKFANEDEMDAYKFGNRSRPPVFTNAWTSFKHIVFYAYGHKKGANRMLEYIKQELLYPTERFAEFIERERKVILAELNQNYKKESKDVSAAYTKFLYYPIYESFSGNIIGTQESIKSISVEDLVKYKRQLLTKDNLVLAVQTSKDLSDQQISLLESIGEGLAESDFKVKIKPKYGNNEVSEIKHFKEEDNQDIFMSFNYFERTNTSDNISEPFIRNYFLRLMIEYVGQKIFREKHGFVYSMNSFRFYPMWFNYIYGFKLSFTYENMEQVLNMLNDFFTKNLDEFLNTKEASSWLESEISDYIFIRNVNYDGDYAQDLALDESYPERNYVTSWEESIEFVSKFTIEDLKNELTIWKTQKPKIWVVSPHKNEQILNQYNKSSLAKFFSN